MQPPQQQQLSALAIAVHCACSLLGRQRNEKWSKDVDLREEDESAQLSAAAAAETIAAAATRRPVDALPLGLQFSLCNLRITVAREPAVHHHHHHDHLHLHFPFAQQQKRPLEGRTGLSQVGEQKTLAETCSLAALGFAKKNTRERGEENSSASARVVVS